MLKTLFLVSLLSVTSGCEMLALVDQDEPNPQPAPSGMEAQENAALAIIWGQVYGQAWEIGGEHPSTLWNYGGPVIFWHYGDTCGGNAGQFQSPDGSGYGPHDCVDGEYHAAYGEYGVGDWEDSGYEHANTADLEWHDGGKMSDTCLAHELGHALKWYQTGSDIDANHTTEIFGGSSGCQGAPGSLVRQAYDALIAAGL